MKNKSHLLQTIVAILVVFSLLFTNIQSALAGQGQSAGPSVAGKEETVRRDYHPETGKLAFLGAQPGGEIAVEDATNPSFGPSERAESMLAAYASEFGIRSVRDELRQKDIRQTGDREITRYQQVYQGIPVMGGELVVNATTKGSLLSMNGEISPDLALDTTPVIPAEEARASALSMVAKGNQMAPTDFETTEPELWIYDSRLLEPDGMLPALVWRMDVRAVDGGMPVNELVLIDARRGHVALHFNQVDTFWHGQGEPSSSTAETTAEPVPPATSEPLPLPGEPASQQGDADALTATWYVATTGDDSNDCLTPDTPCATINGAIGKAESGAMILVASGTYTGSGTEVVLINKDINLSGGWNISFSTRNGISIIDGQDSRRGISIPYTIPGLMVTIEYFLIQNGSAPTGGGILTESDNHLILNNVTVFNNNATDYGGGGGIKSWGTLTLNNSTVSGNTASYDDGGGINGEIITINSSTISNNSADDGGGGVYSNDSLNMRNSIIANNTDAYGPDCSGWDIVSSGYNLIGVGCMFTPAIGDVIGASDRPIKPRLMPLADNGGFTLTHALIAGSPAMNAGNPATPGSGENACPTTDQRGVARPIGNRCDIGAYEGSVPWVSSPLVSTYNANGTSYLPGHFLCDQNQPNCTNGSNPHADGAHKYALGTYNFYAEKHLRDSIDNYGMIVISTVHYCSPYYPCPYANAFWDGEQMVYGKAYGFPLADDVVAHELTHGVTQYESNLFYYYQSGAINESFSDIWGELYDQSNGLGNDTAGVKWLIGEDVSGLGAIRSMSNPPAYGDPDSLSSPNYYVGEEDNGGVHFNSGVNNKAAYLMVQGGAFGGKTVTALGVNKTLAIYYEAQTNLLVSGSDYADLYNLLYQACLNQVGNDGILMADCQEVRDATDAVRMDQQPANAPGYNPDTPLCSTYSPNMVFSDDLEAGEVNWYLASFWSNGLHSIYDDLFAHSGEYYLYADDSIANVTDTSATLKELPVPYNAYLHFSQAYNFESTYYNSKMYYFDGGVLEYSTNAGLTWNDAGWMMDFNGYKGVIYKDWVNPLKNRSAFVGSSKGYISTRLNLAPLAGSNVKFRWRMGLDDTGRGMGWWVDDIKMYTCGPNTSFADVPNTHWAWQYIETLYSARITGGCRTSPLSYCPNNTVTRGQMAVFLLKGIHGSSYAPPLVGESTGFNDVPVTYWAAAWVKQLAAEGITGGCGNGNYCPDNIVTRAQMAVFLLKAKYGNSYTPPALGDAGSGFADVPASNLFAPWIKQLAAEGITGGCSSGNYCPNNAVTRAQMAVFLVKAFELP